jgi:hypothetical protein
VSRLQAGEDALLSTWRRAFAAMGFRLVVVPLPTLDAAALRSQAYRARLNGRVGRRRVAVRGGVKPLKRRKTPSGPPTAGP